jgi:hypothetical protein
MVIAVVLTVATWNRSKRDKRPFSSDLQWDDEEAVDPEHPQRRP